MGKSRIIRIGFVHVSMLCRPMFGSEFSLHHLRGHSHCKVLEFLYERRDVGEITPIDRSSAFSSLCAIYCASAFYWIAGVAACSRSA